jgi:hypothetical protein
VQCEHGLNLNVGATDPVALIEIIYPCPHCTGKSFGKNLTNKGRMPYQKSIKYY